MTNAQSDFRQLIVETSTRVVAALYAQLGLYLSDGEKVRSALELAIRANVARTSHTNSLYDGALECIEASCGARDASIYKRWMLSFPSGRPKDNFGISSWETVWPDLTHRLRKVSRENEVYSEIADSYWDMLDNNSFNQFLKAELTKPLADWDKTVLSTFAGDGLSDEQFFFTSTLAGSARQELANFWKATSLKLSDDQKEGIWHLGEVIWMEEHAEMGDDDFMSMRASLSDDELYALVCAYFHDEGNPLKPLPKPDEMLLYCSGQGAIHA